jgi:UDP-N-acetylglucosamine 2-epimerase (non-hydrolysing)
MSQHDLSSWRATTNRFVTVVVGTRAQLIKMAPLLRSFEACRHPYRLLLTGQHHTTMRALLNDFCIRTEPNILYSGKEISGIGQMAVWLPLMLFRLLRRRRQLLRAPDGNASLVLVHGDTFSTLLGALAGRLAACPVGHVESGLRSFNSLNPFPEEITRLLVFRLASLAFCPGAWAAGNMANYRATVVDTEHNTLLDALRFAVSVEPSGQEDTPAHYCVASTHRFENLFFRRRLEWIIATIVRIAETRDVIFVLHPATERRLRQRGLIEMLADHPRVHLRKRMAYLPFVRLLQGADFVMTDGGSNQEELYYLRKPTLLLRSATERQEGLDGQAVLSNYCDETVMRFLAALPAPAETGDLLWGQAIPCAHILQVVTGHTESAS